MIKQPLISICIANYNGISIIDDCLKSILSQTGDLAIEIIVHDDASSDTSADYIRKNYPGLKLIESKENVGFCIANNRMLEIAKGDYFLLLNNDATLLPDALITLYEFAENHHQPAILGLPQYNEATDVLLDNGSLLDPFLNPMPNRTMTHKNVGMIMGACLWIPKGLWYELDGFPVLFESIGEDLYLCCYARLAGYTVLALGESGYRHKVGISFGGGKVQGGRLSTTRKRRSLSERNKNYCIFIFYPALLLLFILPVHLLFLLLEGITLSLLKRDASLLQDIHLPALKSLWKERKEIHRLRHKCQAKRNCSIASWLSIFRPLPHKIVLYLKHGLPEIR